MDSLARLFPHLSFESLFNRPLVVNSISQSTFFNIKSLSPRREGFGFTLKSNKNSVSPISTLFLHGSPPAVFLAIVSVIIYAFNSGLFLTMLRKVLKIRLVHIVTEIFKGIPQTFDTSPAVPEIRSVFATSLHGDKNSPKTTLGHSVSFHVFAHKFCAKATTRFRMSGTKIVIGCNDIISTFTNTVPKGVGVFSKKETKNFNSTEGLTSYILSFHGSNTISI